MPHTYIRTNITARAERAQGPYNSRLGRTAADAARAPSPERARRHAAAALVLRVTFDFAYARTPVRGGGPPTLYDKPVKHTYCVRFPAFNTGGATARRRGRTTAHRAMPLSHGCACSEPPHVRTKMPRSWPTRHLHRSLSLSLRPSFTASYQLALPFVRAASPCPQPPSPPSLLLAPLASSRRPPSWPPRPSPFPPHSRRRLRSCWPSPRPCLLGCARHRQLSPPSPPPPLLPQPLSPAGLPAS